MSRLYEENLPWSRSLKDGAEYFYEQESERLPDEIKRKFYTVETHDHIAFYGEIKAAYIIE
ncbi:MAG: hypothetical protein II705_01580, partial [Clostridia bacterium]|nr:hypothetical protein [Clostridia bacterium]